MSGWTITRTVALQPLRCSSCGEAIDVGDDVDAFTAFDQTHTHPRCTDAMELELDGILADLTMGYTPDDAG